MRPTSERIRLQGLIEDAREEVEECSARYAEESSWLIEHPSMSDEDAYRSAMWELEQAESELEELQERMEEL